MTESEKFKHSILSKIQDMERGDLLRVLNGAYIAERFFGKSGSWFSQKLNNNIKNGKPCKFTNEELKTLATAIYTITIELQEVADEIDYGTDVENEEEIDESIENKLNITYSNCIGCCTPSLSAGAEQEAITAFDNERLRAIVEKLRVDIDVLREQNEMLKNVIIELKEQANKQ